jgi:thiol:disulfide interchange protein
MTKNLFLLIAFFSFANSNAQIKKPVKWTTKVEHLSENEYNLILKGTIEKDWHVYSQYTPDGGPLPMFLKFEINENFELVGKPKESAYKKQLNEVFGVEEYFFENQVTITQKVKVDAHLKKIKVNLDYQTCKNACINDNIDFILEIPKDKNVTILPNDTIDSAKTETQIVQKTAVEKTPSESKLQPKPEPKKGLWTIFFVAFLFGFTALLTPCVFPMIPMTVSFFTKQSKNKIQGKRNALIYGLSIIIIYVVLGLIITKIFGADALNSLATNVWFNLIFFVLLVVFAASFLGAFEIMLPNSWANIVDQQADRGGFIGIFFMALALAVVSFSCTGPIVGTLLVEAASKGGIAPIIGMLGFSTALALPFMLFAMFPSWLQSLPKSGGWLNTVKVCLGFLELALAFKFLSNADLVLQTHYLEREVFLAIWVAIFGTWSIYLLGKITLPHDSPLSHISVGRLSFAMIIIAFTFYMIPGLFGAPVKLISAFVPPQTYSEKPAASNSISTEKLPNGAEIGPNGIIAFTDYETGLAYAKTINKPVLLDFTGHACSNCRLMENNVWSNEKVLNILKNQVVLISLYADDKRELPKNQQFISKTTGENIETIGDKWTDFMISKYNTNTQPLYVLIDLNGNNLNPKTPTTSYNPDVALYENWLKTGISNFKK